MKIKTLGRLLLIWAFALPSWMAAQTASEPDASPVPKDAAQPASSAERPVSWKQLIPNLASDQKQIWRFPIRAHRDKHWVPAAAVLAVTAGLIAADPHEGAYFRRASAFDGFNHVFYGNATGYGMIAAPVSLYAAGLIGKDSKMRGTALLAGEAVVDSEILTTVLKDSLRRLRPVAIPPQGNFSDTWFESSGSVLRGNGSMPSGHTIAAFSIATVFARRYGNHRWVPFVAYGLAGVVGFSRMTLSAHFASDVFMGASLGYSISRFAVLRQ